MKSSDRAILIGIAVLGVVAAFWFLALAPKRQEASDLSTQVTQLQSEVDQAEQEAAAGLQAKQGFKGNYRRLVTLGKAVPTDADTPSLLTELQTLSDRADVDFRSITLESASGATSSTTATTTTDSSAMASEASAALLPIGATVGSAGLPTMPYSLQFQGGFFQIADFFGRLDDMVYGRGDGVAVDGRLLTIDGFSLSAAPDGFPNLSADVSATSYLTPADQGATAGATPSGPAADTVTTASDGSGDQSSSQVSAAAVAN